MSTPSRPYISGFTSARDLEFSLVKHLDMTKDADLQKASVCSVFYTTVSKLFCTLVFQNLQVLFASNLDLSFIIRKRNDWHHFGLDYVTSLYLTDRSVKYKYPVFKIYAAYVTD